jgi:hypothetical protein
MELHPFVFVLLAYGLAAVISVIVAFIVKIISSTVQRKSNAAGGDAEAEGKGGNGS